MRYAHGDLCKHLGIDLSTDHPDWYSNLFLNAYINCHAHTKYLKMIEVYSPFGIWHVFLYSTGPLVEPLKPLETLFWLESFKTFYLAEKPLITFTLIYKPLIFAKSV